MFRRFAGSGFALVLVAIVAMKHVALGFCLCEEQVVTNPATCCAEHALTASCCCSEDRQATAPPCRDCVIDLELDPGDFLWSVDEFTPDAQVGTPIMVPAGDLAAIPARAIPVVLTAPVRGSPPGLPPVYLRQSVLRL